MHRLVADRPLMLGCIHIPHEQGLAGHSDADVLAHAVIDALLGPAALDDIGRHFPDTQEAYRGISGQALLERTGAILRREGWHIRNIDALIVAQRPRLAPYTHSMRAKIAAALACGEENINIKAKSTEGLGFEGEGLGISAQAVAMLCQV